MNNYLNNMLLTLSLWRGHQALPHTYKGHDERIYLSRESINQFSPWRAAIHSESSIIWLSEICILQKSSWKSKFTKKKGMCSLEENRFRKWPHFQRQLCYPLQNTLNVVLIACEPCGSKTTVTHMRSPKQHTLHSGFARGMKLPASISDIGAN